MLVVCLEYCTITANSTFQEYPGLSELCCDTKRVLRSSLEHRAKGLTSVEVIIINPLLFGDTGGFSLIQSEKTNYTQLT